MNDAEKKFEALKQLVSKKSGMKITPDFEIDLRSAVVTELVEEDHDENFHDFLVMSHGPIIEIAGNSYDIGPALRLIDNDRYHHEMREFLSQLTVAVGFYRFYEDQIDALIEETEKATPQQIMETFFFEQVS